MVAVLHSYATIHNGLEKFQSFALAGNRMKEPQNGASVMIFWSEVKRSKEMGCPLSWDVGRS